MTSRSKAKATRVRAAKPTSSCSDRVGLPKGRPRHDSTAAHGRMILAARASDARVDGVRMTKCPDPSLPERFARLRPPPSVGARPTTTTAEAVANFFGSAVAGAVFASSCQRCWSAAQAEDHSRAVWNRPRTGVNSAN